MSNVSSNGNNCTVPHGYTDVKSAAVTMFHMTFAKFRVSCKGFVCSSYVLASTQVPRSHWAAAAAGAAALVPRHETRIRAQFHGSAYRRILRLRSRFPAYVQAPNFCASLVSVECLVTRSTHAQKPKFAANPWNTLAVSTEFPASVSAESALHQPINLRPIQLWFVQVGSVDNFTKG